MDELISIKGPLEEYEGELALIIPLDEGGYTLSKITKKIGFIKDNNLIIIIKPWLAEKLNFYRGCIVHVDNADGKFNIWRVYDDLLDNENVSKTIN